MPRCPMARFRLHRLQLHKETGVGARALEFTILCAVRTGDVLGPSPMLWSHVDLERRYGRSQKPKTAPNTGCRWPTRQWPCSKRCGRCAIAPTSSSAATTRSCCGHLTAWARGERDHARLPRNPQDMGVRVHLLRPRCVESVPDPYHQRQAGAGLSPRRLSGKAGPPDDRVGSFLRRLRRAAWVVHSGLAARLNKLGLVRVIAGRGPDPSSTRKGASTMANPTYPKGFPAHLATNFRWMVSNGRSAAQVCEILTMVLRHREIKTVPPLPDGWRLLPVGGEQNRGGGRHHL